METNNKIIAEFMGFEIKNKINYIPPSLPNFMKKAEHLKVDKSENLPFHNDWNWLMQVVEKIESIKIETYKVRVDIYFNCCQINPTHWEQLISIYGNKETKIEAVYNACIEFIKWYNENSAKEK